MTVGVVKESSVTYKLHPLHVLQTHGAFLMTTNIDIRIARAFGPEKWGIRVTVTEFSMEHQISADRTVDMSFVGPVQNALNFIPEALRKLKADGYTQSTKVSSACPSASAPKRHAKP